MTTRLRKAFINNLYSADWMDYETREAAKEKVQIVCQRKRDMDKRRKKVEDCTMISKKMSADSIDFLKISLHPHQWYIITILANY